MKVAIDLNQMRDTELLRLARACVREINERQYMVQFKVVKKE